MLFSKYHLITSTNKGEKFSLHVANVCHEKWQPNHSRDDMFETILTAKNTDHNSLSIHTYNDTHGLMNQSHSTQRKTCQQVYSRGHRQDIVWLKLCTSISMFIVHQSVWNICTHTAYNVHKTHNKTLSSRDINSSGGGESPCLSSWSMTLQDARGDSGVCALLLGMASDVRAGCRGFPGYVTRLPAADRENLSLLRKLSADFQSHI